MYIFCVICWTLNSVIRSIYCSLCDSSFVFWTKYFYFILFLVNSTIKNLLFYLERTWFCTFSNFFASFIILTVRLVRFLWFLFFLWLLLFWRFRLLLFSIATCAFWKWKRKGLELIVDSDLVIAESACLTVPTSYCIEITFVTNGMDQRD